MTNLSDIIPPSNVVTDASTDTLTNKTLTSPKVNEDVAVTSTATELNLLDGSTAGTVVASKAVVVDSNKDIASFRNVTLTGELDAATLDISGNADIDGTTNLDAVDIDGAVQIDNTVSVGVDDTGYDVKFFGDTASAFMLWDTSADDLILGGDARVVVPASGLVIGSTAVTSTAAELNALDGITAVVGELNALDIGSTAVGTAVASKAVILDANKDYTGMRNLTISGELDAATLDISGDVDVDGTLETDNLTIGGAQGSDGQILTSTGSGVGWENAAAGGTNGWEYISQVSASGSSTVDVEGMDSTYVVYKILAYDVQVAGTQFEFKCRFKQGGSYITANYTSKVIIGGSDSTNVTGENVSGNHMLCHRAYMGATTSEVMFIDMTIPNPSNSTTDPLFFCESVSNRTEDQGGNMYRCLAGGVLKTSGAITGVQFFPNSGTVTSGIFKLYGLKGS